MTTPDFYGPVAETTVQQTDSITLSHTVPAALSRQAITSYPALETAGAPPTADVITVYDVTTSTPLVYGTDYTLVPSGAGETLTYSVLRLNTSTACADGDTVKVTYRWGTIPDFSRRSGEWQGTAGAAPTGTQFQAGTTDTEGASASGLGSSMPGGSLTDPASGTQGGSETGAPGSEYAVGRGTPSAYGWTPGSPDTAPGYGSNLPENFAPVNTNPTGVLDTTIGGGSALVSGLGTPPAYRPPSPGVAASVKDTTLTEILGNQISATPRPDSSSIYTGSVDTSYIGAPAAPTSLLAQSDAFAGAAASTRYYLSQPGLIPSSVVVTDSGQVASQTDNVTASHTVPVALSKTGITSTQSQVVVTDVTTSTTLVLGTDYTLTPSGTGATATYSITRVNTSTASADGDTWHVTYSWGNAAHFTPATLVAGQDYALTVAGNGATTAAYLTLSTGHTFVAGDSVAAAYSYGDPVYWDSNPPASVPGAPSLSSVSAANRGAQVTWAPPSGTIPVDYYLIEASDGGTMHVPASGQPVLSGQPSPSGGADTGQPTYQADTFTGGFSHSVPVTLSQSGIITPPGQLVVRDITSTEADPMQAGGTVLEYGYDYTVAVSGVGPWVTYQIERVATSVNSADGDTIIVEYWYGADPSSVTALFTQGLVENTPPIYKPSGSTYSQQGYRFRVAAGNRAGLGPFSSWSSYVVPLNTNAVPTGSLDPANTINPIYAPDGTVKAGTGLGG